MKKLTALVFLSFLAAVSVRADVIWQELFNYTNGPISVTGTNVVGGVMVTNWIVHSGSPDDYVNNQRLEIAATGGGVSRSGDVHRNFSSPYNATQTALYASFVLNCTNLPNVTGVYFAHFLTNASSAFVGKLYALVGTNLCLPNTYRLGVSALSSAGPTAIFPVDLAMNQDYQIVFEWDPVDLWAASLWVDPNGSSDVKIVSSEIVTAASTCPPQSLAFRQASSAGNWFCTISNLVVATTFDEAATNVWTPNSVNPSIAYPLRAMTNYVEVPSQLSVVAAGQGLADFSYFWYKDGADYDNPSGNSNILPFPMPELPDTGNYSVVVSNNLTHATATSGPVLVWVTNGPPFIAVQPTNQQVYPGKNVTISVGARGTPTLGYSWQFNGGAPTNTNVDPTTTNTAALVIVNVQSNNGTLGKYNCLISNDYGITNSYTNNLTLLIPQTVNIDTLRGMVDPVYFLPTNTTTYYTVTNAVVYTREVTNADGSVNGGPFTRPSNAEFFIQDDSGGLAVFVSGGATTAQPRQGDIVTVTGPLGNFNGLLQFSLNNADPSTSVKVTGHTDTLPAPVVLPFSFTNGIGFVSVSNVIRHYEGLLVTLTNVYFPGDAVGGSFTGKTYIITNASGGGFSFFLNAANTNIIGQPIPQFARTVTGAMGYYNSATDPDRSKGFEIDPSAFSDIVAGPAAPVAAAGGAAGGAGIINWIAEPFLPYSVWWSTNVALPFPDQWTPIATGLTFETSSGTFTDSVNTSLPAGFYRISSP